MVNGLLAILAGIACVVFCRQLAGRVAQGPYTGLGRHTERIALAIWVLAGAILIAWGIRWLLTA